MPLVSTPNGSFFIADGASPQAVAAAKQDFMQSSAKAASSPSAVNGDLSARFKRDRAAPMVDPEVQRRVQNRQKGGGTGAGIASKFMQGITANFNDELQGALSAGTVGVAKAIKHGDIHEIGREYNTARDTERAMVNSSDGTGGTLSEIAGALMNPIGDGVAALKFGGKAVPLLAKAATKLEKAPALVRGVAAGANQGATNAVGSDNGNSGTDLLTRAGQGAFAGGLTGGVFGGAVTGVRRGAQILADRGANAGERIAYGKIGNMLEKAGVTPQRAERELAVTNARGGDGMLQDMSPGLRAQSGALARRPDLPASNDLINRGEDRLLSRPDRFDAELKNRVGNADADAHIDAITGARKAHGDTDYKAALDGKFHWDSNLQDFMDHAPPEMHSAMRDGAHLASLHDQDIGQLGMRIHPQTGAPIMDTTPSMRVFDYAKRAMDAKIASAYKAGDNATASGLSHQLGKFKQLIMDANPTYAPILAKQRDFFQRAEATELGLNVVSRMRSEPRKVLKELQALDPSKHADARQGIADALIATRTQKADPVAHFMSVARSPEQRKILEFAFNGKGNLGRFQRWAQRELRGKQADVMTAPGRQSITSTMDGAQDSLNGGIGGVAEHAGRGFAFGGPAGAAAAVFRKFNDLRTGMSPHALDAMARALMTDGEGVADKVAASRKFTKVRKGRNARAAIMAAKAGQQTTTDYAGD